VHRVPAHLARRFHQLCLGVLSELTEPEGLSPIEYAVLGSLDDRPGVDQRTLAERIGVDTVTAHHLVESLEQRALVDRRIDLADRRARILALTPQGTTLRRRLRPAIAAGHDRIMAPLSEAERATLLDLLTRVIEANESYARPGNGRRKPTRKASQPSR